MNELEKCKAMVKDVLGDDTDLTFDIEESCFGDDSYVIQIAEVFDSKKEAEDFVKLIKALINLTQE